MSMRRLLRSLVLWVFGGTMYFLLEVVWKMAQGHPNEISWTMLVLAAMICIPLDQVNEHPSRNMPLWLQAVLGGMGITAAELVAGLVLNVWLGLGIWDYSNSSINLCGQICLTFALMWVPVAGAGIVMFAWLRYWLYGERRPEYAFWRRKHE